MRLNPMISEEIEAVARRGWLLDFKDLGFTFHVLTTPDLYARLLHSHVMRDAQPEGGTLGPDKSGDNQEAAL